MAYKKSAFLKSPESLSLREKLGLRQEDYADFCGISGSLLSMIEMGLRKWPDGKSDTLLHAAFVDAQTQFPQFKASFRFPDEEKKSLRKKLNRQTGRTLRLEDKRDKTALAGEQALNLLKTCEVLLASLPDPDSFQHQLAALWKRKAQKKWEENSPLHLDLLRLQLEFEEKVRQRIAEELALFSDPN